MKRAAALPGAMVSVLGVTLASTVTDERGQFTLNQLPAGDYLLRAHMLGFAASTGAMIRVGSSTPFQRVQLRRLDGAVATDGTAEAPVKARPIIAAGFELPRGGEGTSSASSSSEHPHDDAAWWTRHLKRSILKDSSPDSRADRRRRGAVERLAVRPRDGIGGQRGVVALHRFPVLGRGQLPDDRRGRAGRIALRDGAAARRGLSRARRARRRAATGRSAPP